MNDLYLRRGAERRLRGGHLWVYSNEVDAERSPLGGFAPGEPVRVRDGAGRLLGSAYVEPHSLICARLYDAARETLPDAAFFHGRVLRALALRQRVFDAPFYRLLYGDSDGVPGVVVDRFGDYLVLQLHTAGMERHLQGLVEALGQALRPAGVLLRRDSRSRREQGISGDKEVVLGEVPDVLPLIENGVEFLAPVHEGQKTGWFFDHRESRARLAAWTRGETVLDVYSYLGGWGVQAAAAGARSVLCVDSSAPALEGVHANAERNGVAACVSTRRGQAADVLAALADEGASFGVVVLDPPAFIQRRKDLKKGIAAYRRINELALRLVAPEGLLVSASCSMHLSRADLVAALQSASVRAGCSLQIVAQGGQAADHPVHPAIPETGYLKTLFARRLPDS